MFLFFSIQIAEPLQLVTQLFQKVSFFLENINVLLRRFSVWLISKHERQIEFIHT